LQALFETDQEYADAAALCPRILRNNAELWEKWVLTFAKQRQLGAISTYIPVGNPTLSQALYEMVLNYFLTYNHEKFARTIQV
jgi:vacuolar protein sorting-associated protein 41